MAVAGLCLDSSFRSRVYLFVCLAFAPGFRKLCTRLAISHFWNVCAQWFKVIFHPLTQFVVSLQLSCLLLSCSKVCLSRQTFSSVALIASPVEPAFIFNRSESIFLIGGSHFFKRLFFIVIFIRGRPKENSQWEKTHRPICRGFKSHILTLCLRH